MDSIKAASKIQDQATRDLLFYLLKQDKEKDARIAELERKQQPTPAIGFHQNASTSSMDLAFPNRRKAVGD